MASWFAVRALVDAPHSEETNRTNCSRVQQSRPGTIIYEPYHLWVPYTQGQKHAICMQTVTRQRSRSFSSVHITRSFVVVLWFSFSFRKFHFCKMQCFYYALDGTYLLLLSQRANYSFLFLTDYNSSFYAF